MDDRLEIDDAVIVFQSEMDIQEFQQYLDKVHISLPEYIALDYRDKNTGLPAGLEKQGWEGMCFALVDGTEEDCRNLYAAMQEDWRKRYIGAEEGIFDPNWIEIISRHTPSRIIRDEIEKIEYEPRGRYRDESWEQYEAWKDKWEPRGYAPNNPWVLPAMIARPIADMVESQAPLPPAWIEGLMGVREGTILGGAPGLGKTAMVNYIAHTLATSSDLWGFKVPKPLVSLIIQAELDGHQQRRRLQKLYDNNPEFVGGKVYYLGNSLLDENDCRIARRLDDPDFQEEIQREVRLVNADIVWIDPLVSFNPHDENSNTLMRQLLDSFEAAMAEVEAGVAIMHHTGKNGDFRGASALTGWSANTIMLTVDRVEKGEARIKVTPHKTRSFSLPEPFYLTRTKDFSFEITENRATKIEDRRLKQVVKVLKDAGGRIESQKEFISLIGKFDNGVKPRAAVSRIKDARDCGLVVELDEGKKNQKAYALPEK